MRNKIFARYLLAQILLGLVVAVPACKNVPESTEMFSVPEGYYATLEVTAGDRMYRFGPFVGYYFRPVDPSDLSRLEFLCFNERNFYTLDQPAGSLLFSGEAVLSSLPDSRFSIPTGIERILPVFQDSIPEIWLGTRPVPADEFRHFHSCYDDQGAVLTGYWLRHVGEGNFTYDMGGRVGPDSPLYHEVIVGVDRQFAAIVEFDRGP